MPTRDDHRPDYGGDVRDFLERTGAIRIAIEITMSGASFSELERKTSHSTSTLSKRLKEGENLGLWNTIAKRGADGPSRQKYVPTSHGLKVFELLHEAGVFPAYVRYHEFEQDYEDARDEFLDLVAEKAEEGEIPPPSVEAPKPTGEALESIGAMDQLTLPDPFEQARSIDPDGDDQDTLEGFDHEDLEPVETWGSEPYTEDDEDNDE